MRIKGRFIGQLAAFAQDATFILQEQLASGRELFSRRQALRRPPQRSS